MGGPKKNPRPQICIYLTHLPWAACDTRSVFKHTTSLNSWSSGLLRDKSTLLLLGEENSLIHIFSKNISVKGNANSRIWTRVIGCIFSDNNYFIMSTSPHKYVAPCEDQFIIQQLAIHCTTLRFASDLLVGVPVMQWFKHWTAKS